MQHLAEQTRSPHFPTSRRQPSPPLTFSAGSGPANEAAGQLSRPPFPLPLVPRTSLSTRSPQRRLKNWRLVHGKHDVLSADRIIGATLRTAEGHTSPITHIDPVSRRIRTRSGSIYELGCPEMAFERIAPEIVRQLGF